MHKTILFPNNQSAQTVTQSISVTLKKDPFHVDRTTSYRATTTNVTQRAVSAQTFSTYRTMKPSRWCSPTTTRSTPMTWSITQYTCTATTSPCWPWATHNSTAPRDVSSAQTQTSTAPTDSARNQDGAEVVNRP